MYTLLGRLPVFGVVDTMQCSMSTPLGRLPVLGVVDTMQYVWQIGICIGYIPFVGMVACARLTNARASAHCLRTPY